MTLTAYAARRKVSKMAVSKAVSSGRLVASVGRDARGRPQIIDADLADREWTAKTDLSKAPTYVKERAEQRAAEPAPPRVDPFGHLPRLEEPADPGAPRSAHAEMTLSEASTIEKVWKAKAAELKYRQDAGELVPAKDVAHRLEDVFHGCRTKLLGVPSRARQALPHLTVADIGVLENLVREALEDLASAGGVA